MTAHDLIASIFVQARSGPRGNVRGITRRQLEYLHILIDRDKECASVRLGDAPGSLVWMPEGPWKYVLSEDPTGGDKHTLTRLTTLTPTGAGNLF